VQLPKLLPVRWPGRELSLQPALKLKQRLRLSLLQQRVLERAPTRSQ
jgi:hypothetical protein